MRSHTSMEQPSSTTRPGGGKPARPVSLAVAAALLLLAGFALAWVAGCGGSRSSTDGGMGEPGGPATTVFYTSTTAASMRSDTASEQSDEVLSPETTMWAGGTGGLGSLSGAEHKVISNASLQIEVEPGKFQAVFEQVRLLADKYGGYVIAADSSASGEEKVMRSGVIALRVPSQSLNQALADATSLGKVTAQQVQSQDVTEEYVDLEARLKNAEAQEEALVSLMRQATTVEDTLRVREVLSSVQAEIEQIKGRLNYLDEHSSYATLTVSLYESGMVVATGGGWGFIEALRDAARALVGTLNELIVFLGGALPVLVLLALIAWVVYLIVRAALRRRDRRRAELAAAYHAQQAGYMPDPSGRFNPPGPSPAGPATTGAAVSAASPGAPTAQPADTEPAASTSANQGASGSSRI